MITLSCANDIALFNIIFVRFSVNNIFTIEVLIGSYFRSWKKDVEFAIKMVVADSTMTTPKPVDITTISTDVENQANVLWMKSNILCYLTIKGSILEHLLCGLSETTIPKGPLDAWML